MFVLLSISFAALRSVSLFIASPFQTSPSCMVHAISISSFVLGWLRKGNQWTVIDCVSVVCLYKVVAILHANETSIALARACWSALNIQAKYALLLICFYFIYSSLFLAYNPGMMHYVSVTDARKALRRRSFRRLF